MCFPSPGDSNGIFFTELIHIRQCHRSVPAQSQGRISDDTWRNLSHPCVAVFFPNLSYTSHTQWQKSLSISLVKTAFIWILKGEMEESPPNNNLPSHQAWKLCVGGWRSVRRKKVHSASSIIVQHIHICHKGSIFSEILKHDPINHVSHYCRASQAF